MRTTPTLRRQRALVIALAAIAIAGAFPAMAQTPAASARRTKILHVQGNVHMLVTPSGNVALQVGDEGALLVDTSVAELSDEIVETIRTLTTKPIRYIVNTSADAHRVGGNESIAKRGTTIAGGNMGTAASASATIVAHEEVLNRMSAPTGKQAPTAEGAWPTDTFFTPRKEIFFNNEAIEVLHQPAAHSNGDVTVFFRRSDVIVAGEIFDITRYPVIDTGLGGSINGVLDALNRLLDLAIPKEKQEAGTYIIPAQGRLCDEADLLEYRDMLTIIRDRVASQVKNGRTLEQVKASRPTLDYDARFGSTAGAWTTDQFVDAVYKSAAAKAKGVAP